MKVETLCNNQLCPIKNLCANFSTDESKNLLEFEFNHVKASESDEVDTTDCDNFQAQAEIEEEFYK